VHRNSNGKVSVLLRELGVNSGGGTRIAASVVISTLVIWQESVWEAVKEVISKGKGVDGNVKTPVWVSERTAVNELELAEHWTVTVTGWLTRVRSLRA